MTLAYEARIQRRWVEDQQCAEISPVAAHGGVCFNTQVTWAAKWPEEMLRPESPIASSACLSTFSPGAKAAVVRGFPVLEGWPSCYCLQLEVLSHHHEMILGMFLTPKLTLSWCEITMGPEVLVLEPVSGGKDCLFHPRTLLLTAHSGAWCHGSVFPGKTLISFEQYMLHSMPLGRAWIRH